MRRREEGKYSSLLYVYVLYHFRKNCIQHGELSCNSILHVAWVFAVVVVDNAVKVVLLDDEGSTGCCCCSYVGCSHSLGTG